MNNWQRAAYRLLCQAQEQGSVKTHYLNLPPEGRSGRPSGGSESPITRAKRRVNKNFTCGLGIRRD